MIQDYIAFGIFSLAVIYSLTGLLKFVVNFNKNNSPACGKSCNCEGKKRRKFSRETVRTRSFTS